MITVIEGLLGVGKTLSAKYLMNGASMEGYHLFSNIHFTDLTYTNVDDIDNLDDIPAGKNMFLVDEAYLSADSRLSSSKKNIAMTNLILQSRKKKIDFILTCQLFGSLDIRIRQLTDYRIIPCITKWLIYPNDLDEYGKPRKIPLTVRLRKLDAFRGKLTEIYIKDVRSILDTYDTYEIAKSVDSKNELQQIILEYAGYDGSKTALQSKLILEYDLRTGDAKNIADYVKSYSREEIFEGLGYKIPENKPEKIGG